MNTSIYFSQYFKSIDSALLEQAASMVWAAYQSGKKIVVVGNGGSAAMASHVTLDLTKAANIR